MASGRLGSALVGANRTITVYDNTSGASAAISLLAKMRSSTSNGTISIILDSSSTAPETGSQLSTTSFTKEVLKLFYNSTTASSVTSVTGKYEYSTYGQSVPSPQITELPSNTVTSSNGEERFNALWMTDDWFGWGGPTTLIPLVGDGSNGSYYLYTKAQYDAAGIGFKKRQINTNATLPTYSYNTSTNSSYSNNYGALDPYCNMMPYFHCATNAYMGVSYQQSGGNSTGQHNRTSNSLFYQHLSNANPGSNNAQNKLSIHASGGIVIFTHANTQNAFIVCYGRTVSQDARLYHSIEDSPTASGSNYPLHYKINTGNTYNSTTKYPVTFFEYNPNTEKSYALMIWNGKRRLLEFDVAAWETKLDNDTGAEGGSPQSYDSTVSAGLITDITDNSGVPSVFSDDSLRLTGAIVRTGQKTWIIPVRVGSDYYIYETNDFKSYTAYDHTPNYSEVLDSNTVVASDGTDTDKITSNFDSLDQGGLIEFQTSFNDYERTGLVISNNDRVIVRNNGTDSIACNVMGYEETT